ncbi:MAG: hypothetical protein Athens071425_407 [Parcubacteria group bacterium Athens0714_25]|nr:MAG: hypothetical protein Athens071425_407 [Parcubacteria group bacterium Athens0714_25]
MKKKEEEFPGVNFMNRFWVAILVICIMYIIFFVEFPK